MCRYVALQSLRVPLCSNAPRGLQRGFHKDDPYVPVGVAVAQPCSTTRMQLCVCMFASLVHRTGCARPRRSGAFRYIPLSAIAAVIHTVMVSSTCAASTVGWTSMWYMWACNVDSNETLPLVFSRCIGHCTAACLAYPPHSGF